MCAQLSGRHDRRPDSTINRRTARARNRWVLEVCKRCGKLSEQYHDVAAQKALYHTRRLIAMCDFKGAREGVEIAKNLGINEIDDRGRFVHWLSRWISMEAALRYQMWRAHGFHNKMSE